MSQNEDRTPERATPDSEPTVNSEPTAPKKTKKKKKNRPTSVDAAPRADAARPPPADGRPADVDANSLPRAAGKAITLVGSAWMIYGGFQMMNGHGGSTLAPLIVILIGFGITRMFKDPGAK